MHHMLGVFNFKELQDRWSLMELSCYPSSWSRGCSAIRWQRSCSDLLQAPQVSTNLGSISLQGCNKLYCLWLSYIPSSLDQNIISWQKKPDIKPPFLLTILRNVSVSLTHHSAIPWVTGGSCNIYSTGRGDNPAANTPLQRKIKVRYTWITALKLHQSKHFLGEYSAFFFSPKYLAYDEKSARLCLSPSFRQKTSQLIFHVSTPGVDCLSDPHEVWQLESLPASFFLIDFTNYYL